MSRIPSSLALLAAAFITLGSTNAFASPTASPVVPRGSQGSHTSQGSYEASAVRLTNGARTRRSLPVLQSDHCLQRFAARQAAAMASKESMYHQPLGRVLRACKLQMAGENVAYGYASGSDAVQAWMHSPGHRANILKPRYRLVAVAAARSASGQWYAAQVFGQRSGASRTSDSTPRR